MTTTTILPIQTVAQRSAVQKTFVDASLLSGFTDAAHFEMLCGEYLATLSQQDADAVRAAAAAARAFVAMLPAANPGDLANFVRQPVQGNYVAGIIADPVFQQSFGGLPHQFAHVELDRLVALQPLGRAHRREPRSRCCRSRSS